ncbi:MAG: type I-E CRISPR-associated protein Cas5/CasD [Gemmataceae bacterium]
MSVLLLRLAGPMQSWGTRSRFSNRDTGLEPSRSGVIGLLCAALGRPREAPLDDFALDKMKMAVRVDHEGRLMRDYHTAQNVRRADPTKGTQETVLSERFYLADADFLVGLEGDLDFLQRLDAALRRPVWTLFLGRKSFVPSLPVAEGMSEEELIQAMTKSGWRKRHRNDKPPEKPLRGVIEVLYGTGEPRQDVPLSFVSRDRRFGVRHVQPCCFPIPAILEPLSESPHVSQQTGSQRP